MPRLVSKTFRSNLHLDAEYWIKSALSGRQSRTDQMPPNWLRQSGGVLQIPPISPFLKKKKNWFQMDSICWPGLNKIESISYTGKSQLKGPFEWDFAVFRKCSLHSPLETAAGFSFVVSRYAQHFKKEDLKLVGVLFHRSFFWESWMSLRASVC